LKNLPETILAKFFQEFTHRHPKHTRSLSIVIFLRGTLFSKNLKIRMVIGRADLNLTQDPTGHGLGLGSILDQN
jgi:hypothetical protein